MEQGSVNWVDLAVAGVVLVSAVFAFYRGFVREVLAIAGWVGAALVAVYYFADARPYVERYVADDLLADVVTGGGLFLVSLVVFWLVIHLIVMRVKDSPLNALDRSLGFLFGVARGVVVVVLAYMVADSWIWNDAEHPRPDWLTEARSLPLIDHTAGLITVLVEAVVPEGTLERLGEGFHQQQEARAPRAAAVEVERLSQPPVAAPEDAGGEAAYPEAGRQELDRLFDSVRGDAEGADAPPGNGQ